MTTRKRMSGTARLAVFLEHKSLCNICGGPIDGAKEGWDLDHEIPLALGGDDTVENLRPVHRKCHGAKTKDDVGRIAKAKRQERAHIGAKQSPNPMPCGRSSRLRKKMNGDVVDRETGEIIRSARP